MKRLKLLLPLICFLCVFCFNTNSAFAFEFNFYYQKIEKVYDPASKADDEYGFTDTVKNTLKGWFTNEKVEIKQSSCKNGKNEKIAYKVRTTKVSTLQELYKAMGVTQSEVNKGNLTNGQKALVDTFKMAKSKTITDRSKHAYRKSCDVYLVDSRKYDNDNDSKVSGYVRNAINKDFWPCSMYGGKQILMSSHFFRNNTDTERARSTFLHEYCHTLDKTVMEDGAYGLDNKHSNIEVTTKKAAFIEAWAQYNQMIEFDFDRKRHLKVSRPNTILVREKQTKNGKDIKKRAKEWSAEELLATEGIVNNMLYRLHKLLGKDKNGDDIVSNAFYATNGEETGMSELVKKLVSDNPKYALKIYEIVDDGTFSKMTNEEFVRFAGMGSLVYLKQRNSSSRTVATNESSDSDSESIFNIKYTNYSAADEVIEDSVIIENNSGNPFDD